MQRDLESLEGYRERMQAMIQDLLRDADMPPREVKGCSQEFLDALERVAKKSLRQGDVCPICNSAFLDGMRFLSSIALIAAQLPTFGSVGS